VNDSPLFVVGCPRSGTSLLRDLLRSHPRLSIPPESHFIPRFYEAWGDPRTARQAKALARRILSLRMVRRWELELEPEDFSSCRSFAEVVERLFGEFAKVDGKPRWGDKTPHYVESLPLLAELFPRAKFIHIYRDGRDVARSWSGTTFGPGGLFSAGTKWSRMVRSGRRDGQTLGGRYREIRYESLLEEPRETMTGVCAFLAEPFADAVLTRAERTPAYGGRKPRPSKIDASYGFKWRREMPLGERTIIESVAGDLLSELGYELEGLAQPIPRSSRVVWRARDTVRASMNRVRGHRLSVADWLLERRAVALSRLRRLA
jgi:Sulfotransferase family